MTDGPDVRLRPLQPDDLDGLDAMFRDPEQTGRYAWYGFASTASLHRRIAEDGGVGPTGGYLAVEEAGTWCGYVAWFPEYYGGAAGSQAWRFGLSLVPGRRGHGVGTAATRQLCEYLFSNTPMRRIETCVDPDNTASLGMLARAGFAREGLLRQAEFRAGRWRDLFLYARLRDDQ